MITRILFIEIPECYNFLSQGEMPLAFLKSFALFFLILRLRKKNKNQSMADCIEYNHYHHHTSRHLCVSDSIFILMVVIH